MELMNSCPACTVDLQPICALRSFKGKTVRIGFCSNCGYMGYMERPTHKWVTNFYSSEWDKEFIRSKDRIEKDAQLPKGEIKGSRSEAFLATLDLKPDKNKAVCDIGSGYGQIMKSFNNSGFKQVVGVENSFHRSAIVREVFDLPVIHGEFGSLEVEEELNKYKPFGVMFCHHVFEHVYDPEAVVGSIARLQDMGDFAVFALPDAQGEHINYTSFYLPHLHAFTKESIEFLFNRNGYELVTDRSSSPMNMIMTFRKTLNPQRKLQKLAVSKEAVLRRFNIGLAINQYKKSGLHTLSWWQEASGGDHSKAALLSSNEFIGMLKWYIMQTISYLKSRILHRFKSNHVFLVLPENKKQEFPLEIWFDDDIILLIK